MPSYWAWRYRLGQVWRLPRTVRNAVQRARRGYSDEDAYSIYQHVSAILADSLARLGASARGCPAWLADEHGGDVNAAVEEWAKMLREMAHGFDLIARDEHTHGAQNTADAKRALNLMHDNFFDLWD